MSVSKFLTVGVALLCAAAFTDTALAQGGGGGGAQQGGPPVLAMALAPAKGNARLTVTSTAFQNNGTLPEKHTQNGANVSPPLTWTAGPAGTRSYVLITEDAGVDRPMPVIHWVMYNIPGNVTSLPEGVPQGPTVANPAGAMQGAQGNNPPGFRGPRPPAGMTHPYHFQVFALDTTLMLDPAMASRQAVVDAMKNHVLASGETVANYTGK